MTFEPNGELDLIVAESLRDRAALATVQGRGIGEVRRRVRRRRQRQMAVGLVPAMAGLGWAVTRPAPHSPLTPGGDAVPCGDTPYTGPTTYPPSTTTWGSAVTETPTTITFDANGNVVDPYGRPLGTTTTGIVGPLTTDSDGNAMDANGNVITVPFVTDGNGNPVLVNTTWAGEATTTTTTIDDRSLTSSTVEGESTTTTECPNNTAVPSLARVLVVNASSVGGAEMTTVNSFFPGAAAASTSVQRDETVVLLINPDSAGLAQYVATSIGVEVEPSSAAPVHEEFGLTGVDLSACDVVVVIGNTFATSFAGLPSTTSIVTTAVNPTVTT